ncbi:MFS transporter [Kitasatospora atroaurantiaca]|uniref:Putative MFS family arabinose efflux permease n=1 Tax=Kitasatospora atroaurantiaca TaxID=285545 RepID=A0A561F1V0_9ACTN|nr:MFS transporter [Kitasatospora atroaurantiaca]TWE21833.1 putative MFS family arabinose efflux permease [Kitasatospora atroaurantiaca]
MRARQARRPVRSAAYLGAAGAFAVCMAGTTLPTPLYGLYQEQLGFSELLVTVVFAVYAFAVIAVLLVAGNVSDTVGRRPVLLAGLGFAALSALCFLLEGGLPLLYAGRLMSGLSAGLFTGTATAYVMELAPAGREGRAAFAATAANMGGLGLGPLMSGVLAQYAAQPLVLPFVVHLVLVALAAGVLLALPETVASAKPLSAARPQTPRLPPEVRGVFVPASVAAFAGFALFGVFTAVSPAFLTQTLDVHNRAVIGLIVFSAFLASTAGQLAAGSLGDRRALPLGCAVLIAGLVLLGGSLLRETLWLLVLSALVGGAGQGLSLRGAVGAVAAVAPAEHRAGTISALFVVAYTGISIPVIGVGVLTGPLGLEDAGVAFIACMVLLTASAGMYLQQRPAPAP